MSFVLLPTPFPRRAFEKAVRLQTMFNELMHWVAHDTEFLCETLANTVKVDEFTGNLFNIFERIIAEGGPTQVSKVIHYFITLTRGRSERCVVVSAANTASIFKCLCDVFYSHCRSAFFVLII